MFSIRNQSEMIWIAAKWNCPGSGLTMRCSERRRAVAVAIGARGSGPGGRGFKSHQPHMKLPFCFDRYRTVHFPQ
jgi:hypothetical protein